MWRVDALDREILRHLQDDARLSNVELAPRVRLSPSPCLRRVRGLEEVSECRRMFGFPDYLMRVAVADQDAYEAFYMNQLADLPGVARLNSQFTMKTIKAGRHLPIT